MAHSTIGFDCNTACRFMAYRSSNRGAQSTIISAWLTMSAALSSLIFSPIASISSRGFRSFSRWVADSTRGFPSQSWASGQELRRFTGQNESVYYVVFSPDGRQIISCGSDGKSSTLRRWDATTGEEFSPPLSQIIHPADCGRRSKMSALTARCHPVNPPRDALSYQRLQSPH